MSVEFHEEVVRRLRNGTRLVIATVIETAGSTPRKEGARMAILEDGTIVDSIGGGALEALVIEDARALLGAGGSMVKEYRLHEGDEPGSTGMVCGGRVRVHFLMEVPPERLLVFGAGHVGSALARLASGLGFVVTVLDDRRDFLETTRFPEPVSTHLTGPEFAGDLPPIDGSTFVAVVTRCHRTDLAALRRVATSPARYVGLIGSRRKIRVVMDRLEEEGIPVEARRRIHAPIGLPIGACTPEEIAVSIAAELIRTRRGGEAVPVGLAPVTSPGPAERHRRRVR